MVTKLYPPYIEGTLPAFYITKDAIGNPISATITIPFEMNVSINSSLISGFSLMLKTTSAGTYILSSLHSDSFDLQENTVTFILNAKLVLALNEGQFYKALIAYIDLSGNVGYYSTIGIIKCVSLPTISISNLIADSTNLFNNEFIGLYDLSNCKDLTEKVYSYEFIIYNELNLQVYTSGELLHKLYYDNDYNSSIDKILINSIIPDDKVYSILYKITTLNKLYLSSPLYKITNSNLTPVNQHINIKPTANEDTGIILINFEGARDAVTLKEAKCYGSFLLTRADSSDNYTTWVNIARFKLDSLQPSVYYVEDFTVEHGHSYLYALQEYNIWGFYSSRIYAEKIVTANFEDAFLYDGEKKLKIRYNVDINSFKTTILEQKSNTIGGKYPYITRNGETYYHEFPINGLLALELDIDNCFTNTVFTDLSRASTKSIDNINYNFTTSHYNYSDENIALEREFKLNVLDWLNNGKPKLFKSPYEGNYIIRLMNVSLTPVKELGRFLHSFNSTAFEIADFNYENLISYGFVNAYAPSDFVGLWRSYNFADYMDQTQINLTFDPGVITFTILDVKPGTIIKIRLEGQSNFLNIMIGRTGSFTYLGTGKLIVLMLIDLPIERTYGTLNIYYQSNRITSFDSIIGMSLKTIPDELFIGVDPAIENFRVAVMKNNASFSELIFESQWETLQDYNLRDQIEDYYTKTIVPGHPPSVVYIRKEQEGIIQRFKEFMLNYQIGNLLNKINLTIGNGTPKRKLIEVELATFFARPLIPIYCTDRTVEPQFRTYSFSPYGYPHPIEELRTIELIDPYAIYLIYYLINGEWQSFNPSQNGGIPIDQRFYDPYYKKFLELAEALDDENEDPINAIYNTNVTIEFENGKIIEFNVAKGLPQKFKNLKNIQSINIGTGVIAHLTYQVLEIEYYTEVHDLDVIAAKLRYLNAKTLFLSLLKTYPVISEADYQMQINGTLSMVYDKLLNGDNGFNAINKQNNIIMNALLDNSITKEKLKLLSFYKVTYINNNLDLTIINLLLQYKNKHINENNYGFDNLLIYFYKGNDNLYIYYFILHNEIKYWTNEQEMNIYYLADPWGDICLFAVSVSEELENNGIPVYFNNSITWNTLNDITNAGYTVYKLEPAEENELIYMNVNNIIINYSYKQESEELYDDDSISTMLENELYIKHQKINYPNDIYGIIYFEEDNIKEAIKSIIELDQEIYNKNIPDGINNRLTAINNYISLHEELTNSQSEAMENDIDSYISLYNQTQTAIQRYNSYVYHNWALTKLAHLLTIYEELPEGSTEVLYSGYFREATEQEIENKEIITYTKIGEDDIKYKIATESSSGLQYVPYTLKDIFSIFSSEGDLAISELLLLETPDNYYEAAFNLVSSDEYKTQFNIIITSQEIQSDREDDQNLDIDLLKLTDNAYGYLTLCLCALHYYYEHTEDIDLKLIIQSYYNKLYNLLVEDGIFKKINSLKVYFKFLLNDYAQCYNNELMTIKSVGRGVQGFTNLTNVSLISMDYDDLMLLYDFILNGLSPITNIAEINPIGINNFSTIITAININGQFLSVLDFTNLLIDPLCDDIENVIYDDMKKYTLNNVLIFNNRKEINTYKYRTKFVNNLSISESGVTNPCSELIFNPFSSIDLIEDDREKIMILTIYKEIANIIVNLLTGKTTEKDRNSVLLDIINLILDKETESIKNNNTLSTVYLNEYKNLLSQLDNMDNQIVLTSDLRIITRLLNKLMLALGFLDSISIEEIISSDNSFEPLSIKEEENGQIIWNTFKLYPEDRNGFFGYDIQTPSLSYKILTSIAIEGETLVKTYSNYELPSLIIMKNADLAYITIPIEANSNGLDNLGIYYEYIINKYLNNISTNLELLLYAQKLLHLYLTLIKNYSTKYNTYNELYNNYKTIYNYYIGTAELEFYESGAQLNEQLLIIKQAWWDFLNILDYKYTLERERGLYN